MYKPNPDRFGVANNCDPATVEYFVKIYGYQEALELSNIDRPTSNQIDCEKIQIALNDAAVLINNYIDTAPPQGKLLIAGSYRRTQATLARGYLDSLRPRAHVVEAAEKALIQLELWANKSQPTAAMRFQEALKYWGDGSGRGCGMVRAATNRRRQFTQDSMHRWEALVGSNDPWNGSPRRESHITGDITKGPVADYGQSIDIPISDDLMELNQLINSLENTRALSSFENTDELTTETPEDGSLLTARYTDEFDSLKPGNEY